ncbi:MAG TPA: DUF4350 domain-containing protein [Polyangiales bacterium]|nr:DUF4350 domain-containing protein [Polyangiales bacterium]
MKRAGWTTFAVLAAMLLVLTLDRVAERGRFAAAYSSYGSGPKGSRALYLLIEELVAPVTRWAQDLARLPGHAVLVALGGCDAAMARKVSRYERQELVRWVRAGGVLIVAGAREYLPQAFGVQFKNDSRCRTRWSALLSSEPDEPLPDGDPYAADGGVSSAEPPAQEEGDVSADSESSQPEPRKPGDTTWAVPMAAALRGLSVVPFRDAGELVLMPDLEPELLLGDPRRDAEGHETDIEPLGVVLRHGLGRVIVLASASMLQNSELGTSDGGELFVRLLRSYGNGAPVLFDEYHLGIGERRSLMRYLRQMGAAPLALQLVLLVGLLLWRAGARFGSIQVPAPPKPAESSSFVNALGQLYQRSADARGALELIARDAYARIAAHHHVEAAAPARLAQALAARGATRAVEAVWQIETAAKSGKDTTARLPELVATIDAALARALERA